MPKCERKTRGEVPLPASLAALLTEFRGCFSAWTYPVFCALACGLLAQRGRRTVCGMLIGAQLSGPGTTTRPIGSSRMRAGRSKRSLRSRPRWWCACS